MRILLILIMSECLKALAQVGAENRRVIVADAGFISLVLVVVVVGEVGDFMRPLDASRRAMEAIKGLDREPHRL